MIEHFLHSFTISLVPKEHDIGKDFDAKHTYLQTLPDIFVTKREKGTLDQMSLSATVLGVIWTEFAVSLMFLFARTTSAYLSKSYRWDFWLAWTALVRISFAISILLVLSSRLLLMFGTRFPG